MSTSLLRVVERARREPEGRFHSLAHLINVPALERAFHRLRADAAVGVGVGVDGVSKEQYGQALEANLEDLHGRLRTKRYRHQPLRRVHIPKGGGRTRPIGISAVEDNVVQGALREVLEAVYEQDFVECSYGFRPGRSAHDAIRALNGAVYQGKVSWILEADIESFFDSLDRTRLEEMLRIRVADGSLRRLVGKCVRVGVLHGEERTEPERGTPQGSGLSPLLGNLYLHHKLDVWFEREVKARLGGEAVLVRYCDDFVIGFERRIPPTRTRSGHPASCAVPRASTNPNCAQTSRPRAARLSNAPCATMRSRRAWGSGRTQCGVGSGSGASCRGLHTTGLPLFSVICGYRPGLGFQAAGYPAPAHSPRGGINHRCLHVTIVCACVEKGCCRQRPRVYFPLHGCIGARRMLGHWRASVRP